jgi:hypothetical protein
MDVTDIRQMMDLPPTASGDAIRQIVQVFEDGCRAAAALRRTAEDLSAREIRSELDSIELRMMRQIATICERYTRDGDGSQPVPAPAPLAVSPVAGYDLLGECLSELPRH